jgi:alanine racemase
MTMLDVTDIPCEPGDVATVIGSSMNDCLTVADVATTADLSPYELLTGLRGRMPRIWKEAA